MIATSDLKNATGIGIRALFYIFHPSAIHAEGDVVFGFARDSAGMAADAVAVIDNESVFHA